MRVQFGTYPWAFETPGGGEIQLLKYAEYLPAHGVEVRLHDPWRNGLGEADVFHFFSCIGGSGHFCNYIRGRRIPLVISSSLWIGEGTEAQYPADEIRAQLGLADVVVTNSVSECQQLARVLDLDPELFVPVMNGFDPWFSAAGPALFRDAFGLREPFVLCVGNIEPRKNQLALVRAMRGAALPLVLIGHRRDEAYADAVLAEGGEAVRYLGPIAHEDPRLASAFAACAAFVLPSTLETPGLAALEAAAAGAAVVITAEGSTREYFSDAAVYVDHRDVADIRRGIDRALATGPRPELRGLVTERYGWMTVTAELAKVYRLAQARRDARLATS